MTVCFWASEPGGAVEMPWLCFLAVISLPDSIVLGKRQPSLGGTLGMEPPLLGDTRDVNMWGSVLSPEEIRAVYAGRTVSPNVLDWRALKYEAHGEVFMGAALWPEALS
ncbi:C-reactive protein [Galemys pyrenaicus]|uniref:C-reactive protein n=1 Tax=Galemys pyrenaicus TaxID=202257 RepID=A0A8J5ZZ98_GALPY|nr:C-reactive protein [Galemys pyrenaicus]